MSSPGTISFIFTDADGVVVNMEKIGTDWVDVDEIGVRSFTIEIPENSVSCYVTSVSSLSIELYSCK